MNERQLETTAPAQPAEPLTPRPHGNRRGVRRAVCARPPAARRSPCRSCRRLVAAARVTGLAAWLDDGGGFSGGMHQPVS